jgi:hypothetical protein
MALLEIILLIVLVIPIFAIFIGSPLGRAVARRVEGPNVPPPELEDLVKRVEFLETEQAELTRLVETLKEESQFYQRLLDEPAPRPLPPPPAP